MTSQLATEDLQDLRAEGLNPSDEDVIRLHALAVRITDGAETTAYNAPRFAIAGGMVFWEPTMAALYWYDFAKRFAGDAATEDVMFAFACVHGREHGYLDGLHGKEEIERALGVFSGAFSGTRDEMIRAVCYAVSGNGEVVPEKTEMAKERERKETADERERRNFAALEQRLADAAAATGLTFDDLMCQTPSRLRGMIYAAHVQAGMELTRTSARAHADYLATLHAIAERLRSEKAQREAEAASGTPRGLPKL